MAVVERPDIAVYTVTTDRCLV